MALVDRPPVQMCPAARPTVRSVPGPRYQRVVAARVQQRGACGQSIEVGLPRRNRIRGISRHRRAMAAESRAICSPWGRPGNTRAAQLAAGAATTDQLVAFFEMVARTASSRARWPTGWPTHARAAPTAAGRDLRVDHKVACPACTCSSERAGKPRGGLAERLGRRVAVPERHQRLVTPEHLDERGAGVIRLRGHGTHERGGIERDAAVGRAGR